MTVELRRGKKSSKPGAAIIFKSEETLLQLTFWITGEADFFGIDVRTGADVMHFSGRLLDDETFAQTYTECLAAAQQLRG